MNRSTVLYDACVLYPAPLRSLLMYLAMTDLYRARWSNAIHEEWMRNVQKDYPGFTRQKAENIRDLMNSHVNDCVVVGFEELIPSLSLPDPDDRHVLAAGIYCGAEIILTFNLKDFPGEALKPFGIEVQHPDDFLTRLLESFPEGVCSAAKKHRQSLKNPPLEIEAYLASLKRQGLVQSVAILKDHFNLL